MIYGNMYKQETWPMGKGTVLYRDKVHVARANDDGCWDKIVLGGDSSQTGCDSSCGGARKVLGWGSTRYNFEKYKRKYQIKPLCYDQLKDVEEVIAQLSAIMAGLKKEPDNIVSDFLRLLSLRQAGKIWIAGKADLSVDITDNTFLANCTKIDLGSEANLPTSQLTMQYLNNHSEDLEFQGYFDEEFLGEGKFAITSDRQTKLNLSTQNPALVSQYALPEYSKGGRFWEYGMETQSIGNFMFKMDPTPIRLQHIGNGVLQRVWPYQNVAATVGLTPEYDTLYKTTRYQFYHVYNRAARTVFVGDVSPVNAELKFNMARGVLGEWYYKSPDYFRFTDPSTGKVCEYNNDMHNYGYLVGEYEIGAVTDYPLIEMWILAQREPQNVTNDPVCSTEAAMGYQSLNPYNGFCSEGE